LIRPEAVVQFLDPVFDVATGAVDVLVDELGRPPEIRDDIPGVVSGARGPPAARLRP
jgi:hypothetical protein